MKIHIEPAYTAMELIAVWALLLGGCMLFWYLALNAAVKEMTFNDNVRHARCERHYIAGYCRTQQEAKASWEAGQ